MRRTTCFAVFRKFECEGKRGSLADCLFFDNKTLVAVNQPIAAGHSLRVMGLHEGRPVEELGLHEGRPVEVGPRLLRTDRPMRGNLQAVQLLQARAAGTNTSRKRVSHTGSMPSRLVRVILALRRRNEGSLKGGGIWLKLR